MAADLRRAVAELQRQLGERTAELQARTAERDEALEQQAATAEVLQVINSSSGNLAPVFDAMLEKAMRLCGAAFGGLWLLEGDRYVAVALRGVPTAYSEFLAGTSVVPGPGTAPYRLSRGEPLVHNLDLASEEPYRTGDPQRRALVDLGGARSALQVPLRRDDAVLGVITVYRQEVRAFSDKQIALLQNFAAQAVVAMENARLITETREALDQQTAAAEVLQVINSSPGELAPVFEAMLEKAMQLCEAAFGVLQTYDGHEVRTVATRGVPEAFAEFRKGNPPVYRPGTGPARILAGERVVHIVDLKDEEAYRTGDPNRRALVDLAGARTALLAALRKDRAVVGFIMIYRREVRPFSAKQIALLQSFAAQAVIAMENARLLDQLRQRTTDLQEALEYQTAISAVLRAISGAAFDLEPVLQTVVTTAIRLCRADQAVMYRNVDGEYQWAAGESLVPDYERIEREQRIRPGTGTLVGRAALEARTVHIIDADTDPLYEAKADARVAGIHTMLGVPVLREGEPIGVIGLARRRVEPYAAKEIELVRTFADQAAIAIENTRLFTELRELLDQRTATAEVLGVINSSPGNLAPVFAAMLERATRLCAGSQGVLWTIDGERVKLAATYEVAGDLVDLLRECERTEVGPPSPLRRIMQGERLVQIRDIAEHELYRAGDPRFRSAADHAHMRTVLWVALVKDGAALGAFAIARREAQPFSGKQIALLQNFAAQAVIAMENARLLGEIRQRQAELRVTFDNMGDGVAMFDAELRLAAWNREFQQILDLPDALLSQRPSYGDYVRILAERGEFGTDGIEAELSRRLDATDRELRLERTRPGGRVIEVRRNSVPGGGFVLIYSDVTRRKRTEEAVRAARDAAEAALRELKTAQASLIHAEKMASLGQLTAGIAHEIKNPLNFVNNFAGLSVELLDELKAAAAPAIAGLDDVKRAEIGETIEMLTGNLERIAEHGRRADGIIRSMLLHSRGGSGDWQSVDLNALVKETLNLAYHGARAQDQSFNIILERDLDSGLAPVEAVPQDVTRVFLNLIGNGFYAATKRAREAGGDPFRPILTVKTRDLGDAAEIRIRDNGVGIPPEHRERLFQPFFTTKPTGEGTGLGLSISYDIVTQQHGGTMTVDSEVGAFTEFTVRLPRRRHVATAERPA